MPGREPRPGQGGGPLRPRARDRVHVLRRADHPRRAQAPLPRPHVDDPRLARHAGGDRARREGQRGPAPGARRYPSARRSRTLRGMIVEEVTEARLAAGASRLASLDAPLPREDAGDGALGGQLGRDDAGLERVEDALWLEQLSGDAHGAPARGAAAALRRGPRPARDRRARRALADARVADPARHLGAASRRGVARAARCRRRARPGSATSSWSAIASERSRRRAPAASASAPRPTSIGRRRRLHQPVGVQPQRLAAARARSARACTAWRR